MHLFISVPVALIVSIMPSDLWVRWPNAVADFAAPMSARAAQRVVDAARREQEARRAELVQQGEGAPASQTVYVAQSGHHLTDRYGFLSYWRQNGGVLLFSYPITEEIDEHGRIRQYFERARFEYHPQHENPEYRVQLALLGVELTEGRDFPKTAPGSGELYFAETGHAMSGAFLRFWQKRGGLRTFGFPISEPLQEVSPADGKTYTVQYFERARFELHPEDMEPFYRQQAQALKLNLATLYEVQLGDLGRQSAVQRRLGIERSPQEPGVPAWSPVLSKRRIDVNLTTQQLTAFEDDKPVYRAPVATGKDGFNTPVGSYAIYAKYPRQDMAGAIGGESWYVPNIPWVQYVVGGVALHGTY